MRTWQPRGPLHFLSRIVYHGYPQESLTAVKLTNTDCKRILESLNGSYRKWNAPTSHWKNDPSQLKNPDRIVSIGSFGVGVGNGGGLGSTDGSATAPWGTFCTICTFAGFCTDCTLAWLFTDCPPYPCSMFHRDPAGFFTDCTLPNATEVPRTLKETTNATTATTLISRFVFIFFLLTVFNALPRALIVLWHAPRTAEC